MTTLTTPYTVTNITIRDCADDLFAGESAEDMETIDVDATVSAYRAEYISALNTAFPDARVVIEDVNNTPLHNVVICEASGRRDSYDEGIDLDHARFESDTEDAAQRIGEAVWESGNFWRMTETNSAE